MKARRNKDWFEWIMDAGVYALPISLILLATLPFWPTK